MTTEGSTATSTTVGETASAAADTAREQASQVAQNAKGQARDVVHEAKHQAKSTLHQAQEDLRNRADQEASKLAQTLHDASRQMHSMADGCEETEQQSLAANVVREGANAADRLASHIDQGGLDRVMADVRSWARRNPGGFLLGAAVAGFVAGRVARNLSGNGSGGQRMSGMQGMSYGGELEYGYTPGMTATYDEGTLAEAEGVYPTPGSPVGPTGVGGME